MIRITGGRVVFFVIMCAGLNAVRVTQAGAVGELWASDSLEKVLRSAAPGADAERRPSRASVGKSRRDC